MRKQLSFVQCLTVHLFIGSPPVSVVLATVSPYSLPFSSQQLFTVFGIVSEFWREDVGRKGGD